jgi:transketolase C-terminal domain/subunit
VWCGRDPTAALLAYGPVLLHEALLASERLAAKSVSLAVVNMPWLNRFDPTWLEEIAAYAHVLVVEDHAPVGALGRCAAPRARTGAHGVRRRRLAGLRDTR